MSDTTVLIVDDHPGSQQTARLAVEMVASVRGAAITALIAETGVEAVRMLRMQAPEGVRVVVLDLNFPGDVDGRLIGPLIQTEFPSVQIIPFTADYQAADPRHWAFFGLPEPVIKPCAPEVLALRIQTALDQPTSTSLSPMQQVLVDQARLMVLMIQRTGIINRPMQLGLLVHSHLEEAGLRFVLGTLKSDLPLEIAVVSTQADRMIAFSRAHKLDMLVAVPSALEEAQRVVAVQKLPLVVYATVADARTLLANPNLNIVVGPTTPNELMMAFMVILRGQPYQHPQLAAVLSLTPRQRQIIELLLKGATTEQIAQAIGVSLDRLRHVIAELYKQVGVPPVRQALLSWARAAPLHLLNERQTL